MRFVDHLPKPRDPRPGNVVRVTFTSGDTVEGVVVARTSDRYLILDGPDGVYGEEIIASVEILALLPPEEE